MKLCLSARIVERLDPRPPLEDFAALAASCGFDGVGLRPWQLPTASDPDTIASFVLPLENAGLVVGSITVGIGQLAAQIPLARRLGVKIFQGPAKPDWVRDLDPDMRIGPQMHTGGDFETVASAAQALAPLPAGIGVIVEPANLLLAGERTWSADLLSPLAGRLVGCNLQSIEIAEDSPHSLKLKDGTHVAYRRVPPGENRHIDFAHFFRLLRATGYDDYVNVIEPTPQESDLETFARACADSLRAALQRSSRPE